MKTRFTITLANLGLYNEGIYRTREIEFPATQEEINEAYNYVTFDGMNDYIILNDDADFNIYHFESLSTLNEIAELNDEQYEVFKIILKHDSIEHALSIAKSGDYRLFENVEDFGDVARVILEDDAEFQALPDYVKRHFDYDSYGDEIYSGGQWYEDFDNRKVVEVW
jgi:hypothetical protein